MAMESLSPVIHGSPQVVKAMSEDAEFDLESSETEGGTESDVDAEKDNQARWWTVKPLQVDTTLRVFGAVIEENGEN